MRLGELRFVKFGRSLDSQENAGVCAPFMFLHHLSLSYVGVLHLFCHACFFVIHVLVVECLKVALGAAKFL